MDWYSPCFEAQIVHHDLGTYRCTVVFLDEDIAATLPFDAEPRLRISGELADQPMQGAWQPGRAHWYLMLGKPLLKAAGKGVGDWVGGRFRVEPPDSVDLPEALSRALEADPAARAACEVQTVGKQRALCRRIAAEKGPETIARRVTEVLDALAGQDVPTLTRLRLAVPDPVANP